MSNSEILQEIGKLALARSNARQERNTLHRRITTAGKTLHNLAPLLMREYPNAPDLGAAAELIGHLIDAGGLEQIRKDIQQFLVLEQQITQLSQQLASEGAE